MKKNKLSLSKLKVKSFVTLLADNEGKLKGRSLPTSFIPDQCNNSVVDDSTSNETVTEYGRRGCDGFTMIAEFCNTEHPCLGQF